MKIAALLVAGALSLGAGAAVARDYVDIRGTAAAYARAQELAARYQRDHPDARFQITTGGSSGGIRLFCEGVGSEQIDIAMSVRRMRDSEIDRCSRNGVPVDRIIELNAGHEAYVFIYGDDGPRVDFLPEMIYHAFAAQTRVGDRPAPNTRRSWREISPALPDREISLVMPWDRVFHPDLFEWLLLRGCQLAGDYDAYIAAGMSRRDAEAACGAIRGDGVVAPLSGDYADVEAEIQRDGRSIGLVTLDYYEGPSGGVRAATIAGIAPTRSAIEDGFYLFARPLYFYVKSDHLPRISNLDGFIAFVRREVAAGR